MATVHRAPKMDGERGLPYSLLPDSWNSSSPALVEFGALVGLQDVQVYSDAGAHNYSWGRTWYTAARRLPTISTPW